MGLAEAQNFFDLEGAATNIEIKIRDVNSSRAGGGPLQRHLGFPYFAEDWTRLWPNLFSALQLEKTVYFLVLLLMVLIGAFNIVSTLVMVVMEKKKDIAILRSMGATQQSIRKIFLLKGCVIGVVGTVLGVVLGLAVCFLLAQYKFELPKDVFLISTVPVRIYLEQLSSWSLSPPLSCACSPASIRRAKPPSSIRSKSFAMNSLLSVRDLHKSFVEGASEIHILRGLNLDLAQGERLAVVGQSGVGKSTLLHILGTLDRPTKGAILFEGDALPLDDEAALSQFRNQQIGFVFQFHYLLPDFSALENVMFPALIQGVPEERAKIRRRAAARTGRPEGPSAPSPR